VLAFSNIFSASWGSNISFLGAFNSWIFPINDISHLLIDWCMGLFNCGMSFFQSPQIILIFLTETFFLALIY
jgi:hypothetical protein